MNILNEITIDFDLDSKILSDTPAKLKLREKTLKGIYINLDEEKTTLPMLMLAKKKKKKEEVVEEPVVTNDDNFVTLGEEIKVEEPADVISQPAISEPTFQPFYEETDLNRVVVEADSDLENTRIISLPISEEKEYKMESPIIEEVSVDNIPVVDNNDFNVEIPQVEVNNNFVNKAKIETPVIETEVKYQENALDKANADSIFKQNNKLKDEIKNLRNKEKESAELLNKTKEEYQNEVNVSNELDRTYSERQMKAKELEKRFYDAVEKQKRLLNDMKKSSEDKTKANNEEIKELNNKTKQVKKENEGKLKLIEQEDNKIMQYEQLINSVQALENENAYEEQSYKRAM